MAMRRLAVYCGSRTGHNPAFSAAAEALGIALAEQGTGLVYGAAQIGLMGVVADAVLKRGGEVIGVIPQSLMVGEVVHPGLSRLDVVQTMHQRKARMLELADGMVAMPGGSEPWRSCLKFCLGGRCSCITRPVASSTSMAFSIRCWTFSMLRWIRDS